MFNSLGPDQIRHFVGPDLGPSCLQRLSVDDASRQRFNGYLMVTFLNELIFISKGDCYTPAHMKMAFNVHNQRLGSGENAHVLTRAYSVHTYKVRN